MTQRAATDLTVVLDREDPRPLPVQVAAGIREQIAGATLAPGDTVPSTRFLATRLGVSRGTVVSAYDQLLGEGYLHAAQGRPTTVHPGLERIHPDPARTERERPDTGPPGDQLGGLPPDQRSRAVPPSAHGQLVDLRPGQPDSSRLAGAAWRSAWRHAASQPPSPPPDPLGLPPLREAIGEHLRLMRALPVAPSSLLVTAGAREGLTLLLAATARRNGRTQLRVGLEAPGHPGLRDVPPAHGHAVVPCTVDRDGLRVDLLPEGRDAPDVLIVSPSHQYPLGGSLTLQRRLELLEWAQRWDVLLVEDDFDSELRYVGAPLPTLSALDATGEQVALLGTFSTVLTPSLATGYVVLPGHLRTPVTGLRDTLGVPVAAVTQYALAHLLSSGYLRRHTQRMRTAYRRRREAVQDAFDGVRLARLAPMHGGVDAVILTELPEETVIERCAAAGLLVGRQSKYWSWGADQGLAPRGQGIVVGFAQAGDDDLVDLLPRLVGACTDEPLFDSSPAYSAE